jgi:aspartyl-tRNA(Asn)/glutamyl-tRNA(Gln) amidotransferase subunit A
MMQALAGYDPLDPGSADVSVPDFVGSIGTGLKGIRIGVVRHQVEEVPCTPETLAAFENSIKVFASLGAIISDVTLAPMQTYHDVCNIIMLPEAYAIHERYLTKTPELYGELARRRIMQGAFVRASDFVNALRERAKLVAEGAEVMKKVDILLTPTRPNPAVPLGSQDTFLNGLSFTRTYNVLGYPALSICNGFSSEGLPLSLQIAGRPFEDDLVLKVGDAFEKATSYRSVRPTIAQSLPLAAQ